jgi:hypothetical protein
MAMTHEQFADSKRKEFGRNVTAALKMLIEQKHLYQSVPVSPTDSYISIKPDKTQVTEKLPSVAEAMNAGWATEAVRPGADPVHLQAPDVKVFCSRCKRIEAYNAVLVLELFSRIRQERQVEEGGTQQAFLLAYQCQSCKRTPELFLIRRRGLKLTNEGRSPIEHVDVPAFIPDDAQRFYGGAIVAHQSGQTLAGVFLLRTLLEQWARSASGSKKEQADQVMDDYMATLPEDFSKRFPSMRSLYGELSADIHSATGSADLFERARGQIIQHFDARRMFGLPK